MSESLLNTCFQKEIQVDTDLMLQTLVNLGVCYYKIGLLEESLVCFENCLVTLRNNKQSGQKIQQASQVSYILQQLLNDIDYKQKMIKKLKYRKFKCQLHIQCCIILSEMMRHEEALAHSKYSIHISFKLFLDAIIICYQTLIEQKNPESVKSLDLSKPDMEENYKVNDESNFDSLTVMKLSILIDILHKIKSLNFSQEQTKKEIFIETLQKSQFNLNKDCGTIELQKPDMNFIFNKLSDQSDSLYKCSILQYLQMQYISQEDLIQSQNINDEISEDSIFYNISNLSACFYCASTESRFIEDKNMMNLYSNNIVLESEYMLTKAVIIAYTYLRSDIPFVLQILRVYQRFHNINQQIIAESEEYDESFTPQYRNMYLRCSLGINTLESFIPIIRIPVIVQNQQHFKLQTAQQQVRQTGKSEKFKIKDTKIKTNKQQEKLEKIYMQVGPNLKNEKPSSADNLKPLVEQQNQKQQEKNANLAQLSKIYKNSVLQPKQKKQVSMNNFINPPQNPKQLAQINKKRSNFKQQINLPKQQTENIIINNNINFLINENNWEKSNKLMQEVMSNIKIGNQKKKNNFSIKKI